MINTSKCLRGRLKRWDFLVCRTAVFVTQLDFLWKLSIYLDEIGHWYWIRPPARWAISLLWWPPAICFVLCRIPSSLYYLLEIKVLLLLLIRQFIIIFSKLNYLTLLCEKIDHIRKMWCFVIHAVQSNMGICWCSLVKRKLNWSNESNISTKTPA